MRLQPPIFSGYNVMKAPTPQFSGYNQIEDTTPYVSATTGRWSEPPILTPSCRLEI